MEPSVTVVIPTLNEADRIGETIGGLEGSGVREVIVVDGGSSDRTVEIAKSMGARVFLESANRGRQQNLGAAHAKGEILLFLHADTSLPRGFADQVRTTLGEPGVIGGAFRFKLDAQGWQLRLVEVVVGLRCRIFGLPYGDQAIFVRQDTFLAIGGFGALPVMEDFDLIRRLKRIGRVKLARGAAVTSARRWLREGVWRLTWIHQICILGYLLRLPAERLARLRSATE